MANQRRAGRRYRGKAAPDRTVERRARFIEAGLELFGTRGFGATTVKALCTEARLTERYFYESFADREQLFMEVAARCVAGLLAALTEAQGVWAAQIEAFFRWFSDDRRRARIQLIEPLVMGPRFQALYRDVTAMFAGMLRATSLRRHERALRARRVDPELLASALVGAAVESVKEWMLGGYRRPRAEMVRTLSFLVESLGGEAPRLDAARRARPK
jgi:AcrR family transcriptional regulator